jgi:hypothetical protein
VQTAIETLTILFECLFDGEETNHLIFNSVFGLLSEKNVVAGLSESSFYMLDLFRYFIWVIICNGKLEWLAD